MKHPMVLGKRWDAASNRLALQWENPTDVLTVLLIIGGDIVQKALAQLSGGSLVPVAFSFGWVSYSINALLAAFGSGNLMPPIIHPSLLINASSGYARLNYSWILNSLLRGVENDLEPLNVALCVTIYRSRLPHGRTRRDWLWWSGIAAIIVQLGVAVIPCARDGDWTILFVTVCGIGLALGGGCLPQWHKEKWGARADVRNRTFCLTRGNGFQDVIVIQNENHGCLNLEDLAMPRRQGCSLSCKITVTILAILWIVFLINAAGMCNNTWYLLVVGFLGMVQNIAVAAFPRRPDAMGLPLDLVTRIKGPKVMDVLMYTEQHFPSVGLALVGTFFPGGFRPAEAEFWAQKAVRSNYPLIQCAAHKRSPSHSAPGQESLNQKYALGDCNIKLPAKKSAELEPVAFPAVDLEPSIVRRKTI